MVFQSLIGFFLFLSYFTGHVFELFLRKCGECKLALFGGEILVSAAWSILVFQKDCFTFFNLFFFFSWWEIQRHSWLCAFFVLWYGGSQYEKRWQKTACQASGQGTQLRLLQWHLLTLFVVVIFCWRAAELKPRAEETQRPNLKTRGTKKHAGAIKNERQK